MAEKVKNRKKRRGAQGFSLGGPFALDFEATDEPLLRS